MRQVPVRCIVWLTALGGLAGSPAAAQPSLAGDRLAQVQAKLQLEAAEHPNDPRPHYLLGVVCALGGSDASAERAFASALAIDPEYAAESYTMGLLYYALGMYDEAAQEYQAFVAENPENAAGLYNLGLMLQCTGSDRAAVEAYERAVALNPYEPSYRGNLARLMVRLK